MKRNYIKPEMEIIQLEAFNIFAASITADPTKTTDVAYGKQVDIWYFEEEDL